MGKKIEKFNIGFLKYIQGPGKHHSEFIIETDSIWFGFTDLEHAFKAGMSYQKKRKENDEKTRDDKGE